jgi:hypothetical protein
LYHAKHRKKDRGYQDGPGELYKDKFFIGGPIDGLDPITDHPSSPLAENVPFLKLIGWADIGTLEDAVEYGKPVYKQVKYAGPLGIIEVGADIYIQVNDDWNKDLTIPQRIFRAGIRGAETAITDGASSLVVGPAAAGALQASVPIPFVPAGVGYFVGAYSSSMIIDNAFVNGLNPGLFSARSVQIV